MAKFNEENSVIDTIIEFFNGSTFMKVKPDCFEIGRLHISFGSFDNNKKLTDSIEFYLDMKKGIGLVLCQDILSGLINSEMKLEEKRRMENPNLTVEQKKWAKAVRTFNGGQQPNKANREDGKALAKVLKISKGSKLPVIISCEQGPGEITPQGLIVPSYKKAEKVIRVALTNEELKAMALAIKSYYEAWLASKYVMLAMHPKETHA